jgi:hypothetical protein
MDVNREEDVLMENMDIRLKARGAGVPLWRIAKVLKVSEPTLTRKLRTVLSPDEKAKISTIIAELSHGGKRHE